MSKFCGNCGAQVPEGANVCGNCGTPVAVAAAPVNAQANAPVAVIPGVNSKFDNEKIKKLIAPIAAVAAAVVALIVVIGIFSSSSGCKGIIKDYIKAIEKGDAEKLYKITTYPDMLKNLDEDDWRYFEKDDKIESLEKGIDIICGLYELKCGDDLKFKVTEIEEKKVKESEKENIIERYEDNYDLKVKDVKKYKVEIKIKGSEDSDTESFSLTFVKVNGKWKLEY